MRTILDPATRATLLERLRSLRGDAAPRWGRLTAPRMIAHLGDQMRHTLGDATAAPRPGPLRWPIVRWVVINWLPWPKGRTQGPPEAFLSAPTTWTADLEVLESLVQRFVEQEGRTDWPDHALFGPMSRKRWGRLCYRHFDHHLRQFGG